MTIFSTLLRTEREVLVARCERATKQLAQPIGASVLPMIDTWSELLSLEVSTNSRDELVRAVRTRSVWPQQSAAWAPWLQAELWSLALEKKLTPSAQEAASLAFLCCETTQHAGPPQADVARLAEDGQHLRRVLDMTEVGWFHWDLQTDCIEMSEQMRKQWETPDNAPYRFAFDRIHPDDQKRVQALVDRAIGTGEEFVTEYRLLFDDQSVRWIDARGRVFFNAEKKPLAFVGTTIEVTDRKKLMDDQKNERQWLEAVLARLPIPVIMVAPTSGSHVFSNEAANAMLGRPFEMNTDSAKYGTHFDVRDALGRRLASHEMPSFRSANGERLQNYEVSWHTNGGSFDLLFSSTSIPAMFGRKEAIVCLFQDVTALKLHQRSLMTRVEEWRQDKEQHGKHLATMVHDVRTPLSAASLAAQSANRNLDRDTEKVKHNIGRIESNLRRIDDMLRRLLDAQSASHGGHLQIHRQPARLDLVLEEGIRELNNVYDNRVHFRNNVGEAKLNCDEQALRRVLDNLVTNAVKYGHPDTPIEVQFAGARGRVSLQVHNEGPAISATDQESLFTPYYRAEQAEKSKMPGWGLGLSAVYDIARAHGGNVCLSSSAQGGTTFDVSFPVADLPSP